MTTTSGISMSKSTVLLSPHTKVRVFEYLDERTSSLRNLDLSNRVSIGGVFKLELFLPDDYPMTPPKIRFLTKIFHPNVDKLGRICLDVLKSESPRGSEDPQLRHAARA